MGRRQRGVTLLEALFATLVASVAIVAMFASWGTCFKQSANTSKIVAAEEVARQQIEIAKTFGAANIPTGTYNSSTSAGTWTGAFIPATGWTQSGTAYYDKNGSQLTSSTNAVYSVSVTFTDTTVQQGSGTAYTIQATSLRNEVVTVTLISSGATEFMMGTDLIEGGL
jgi:type II secretory pathway pseudopilin PulG